MHPTVFDNLKTVLEGSIYDFENQDVLEVCSRDDLVDLANLTRTFRLGVTFTSIFGEIELNFPEPMWVDELVFIREDVKTELGFTFRLPKSLHGIGYLQWYKLIQKKLWNVNVELAEEKIFGKDQIQINQNLHVAFKEGIREMDVDRLMVIVDHFVYIGEKIEQMHKEVEQK